MCHACCKQLTRNIDNPKYQPRWRPKTESKGVCSVENCRSEAYRRTSLGSTSDISTLLNARLMSFDIHGNESAVPLCHSHYTSLYSVKRRQHEACEPCGAIPKDKTPLTRHCQEQDIINAYLSMTCSEQVTLTDNSVICLACYKFFRYTVKQIQQAQCVLNQVPEGVSTDDTTETSESLDYIVAKLSQTESTLCEMGEEITMKQYFELITCILIQTVIINAMRQNEALLLPSVYEKFKDIAFEQAKKFPRIKSKDSLPSVRWLLSRLDNTLGDNLLLECNTKGLEQCYCTNTVTSW